MRSLLNKVTKFLGCGTYLKDILYKIDLPDDNNLIENAKSKLLKCKKCTCLKFCSDVRQLVT